MGHETSASLGLSLIHISLVGDDQPDIGQRATAPREPERLHRAHDHVGVRLVQPDTIVPNPGDPQSLNRYSYVGNRPTTYVDPSGHAFASPEGGASGAIAVAVCYALGSQAGQALNVAVAEAQAFVQSLGLQLGNLCLLSTSPPVEFELRRPTSAGGARFRDG